MGAETALGVHKATGRFYGTEKGDESSLPCWSVMVTHAMKVVVAMTDAFALLDHTIFPLREETIPFCITRSGVLTVWLFPRAALTSVFVQGCVNASARPLKLSLEGDADFIDEHHHGFGIP